MADIEARRISIPTRLPFINNVRSKVYGVRLSTKQKMKMSGRLDRSQESCRCIRSTPYTTSDFVIIVVNSAGGLKSKRQEEEEAEEAGAKPERERKRVSGD